jgi:hypothetical protein
MRMGQAMQVRPEMEAAQVAAGDKKPLCKLCECKLGDEAEDDLERGLCCSCKHRPEARRIVIPLRGHGAPGAPVPSVSPRTRSARSFTPAEKALIAKLHGFMPAQQLLEILNERLACDLGPDASPYTMELLYAEIGGAAAAVPAGGHDWASLRKVLAKARRDGVLVQVTEQLIDDFAVVFSLNPRQVVHLKDVVLAARNDEEDCE